MWDEERELHVFRRYWQCDLRMYALRHARDRRGALTFTGNKMHLRLQGISQGKATDSKTAKSHLIPLLPVVEHLVVRMEFFCVIAHLFHTIKSFPTLFANVLLAFMRYLLVLHKLFDLAKLFATLFTFMSCNK